MMTPAYLRFTSDLGNEYLYDDCSSAILPWGDDYDAILKQALGFPLTQSEGKLISSLPSGLIESKRSHIEAQRKRFCAFVRDSGSSFVSPPPEDLERLIWANNSVLVMNVTESCNLRCKYCVYASGTYSYHRGLTERRMTPDVAKEAIDWYVKSSAPQMTRNPAKRLGLSLYGGEPLLNVELIKVVLEYCDDKYPGVFIAVLTTNGTLLTPDNAALLSKHDVAVGVSLDGPEEEHDRLRVDESGRGSFKKIISNLAYIKAEYPELWKKMRTICVHDVKTNLRKVASFFEDNRESIPNASFVNRVVPANTTYYDATSEDDYAAYRAQVDDLRQKCKSVLISGEQPDGYLLGLVCSPFVAMYIRSRLMDHRNPYMTYTGACIPGFRLAVEVDGALNICERVNGTYTIGHIREGGLNYETIKRLLEQYRDQIYGNCSGCLITRLCTLCFAGCEGNGCLKRPEAFCESEVASARNRLSDYVSILEQNKSALELTLAVGSELNRIFQA